jgi:hypothetical protein
MSVSRSACGAKLERTSGFDQRTAVGMKVIYEQNRVFDHSFRTPSHRLRLPRARRGGSVCAGRSQLDKRVFYALGNERDHQSLRAESIPDRKRKSPFDLSDRVR